MKATEIDALFDAVSDFGEDVERCGDMPVKPLSRLRHDKRHIEKAILALHHFLGTAEGRTLVLSRYAPQFARHAVTETYRNQLASALLDLADFVGDSDAALCQLEWTPLKEVERTREVSPMERLTPQQCARVREIRDSIRLERDALFRQLNDE